MIVFCEKLGHDSKAVAMGTGLHVLSKAVDSIVSCLGEECSAQCGDVRLDPKITQALDPADPQFGQVIVTASLGESPVEDELHLLAFQGDPHLMTITNGDPIKMPVCCKEPSSQAAPLAFE